jgi:hypothetical protein
VDRRRLFLGIARGERASLHPRLAQGADLVAHERDEGRQDDGDALAAERGQLEAQRLAAARGHDRQNVAPFCHGGHDFGLSGAEGGESEDGRQDRLRVAHLAAALSDCSSRPSHMKNR